ncbi:hypothetical protein AOLI_G00148880 [Acnodon oligacanthus]
MANPGPRPPHGSRDFGPGPHVATPPPPIGQERTAYHRAERTFSWLELRLARVIGVFKDGGDREHTVEEKKRGRSVR